MTQFKAASVVAGRRDWEGLRICRGHIDQLGQRSSIPDVDIQNGGVAGRGGTLEVSDACADAPDGQGLRIGSV